MGLFDSDRPPQSDHAFWAEYYAYVNPKNIHWRRKCQAVRRRCHGVCERCKRRPMAHTHHLSYKHFKNEPLEDLIGLCLECHQEDHPHRDLRKPRVIRPNSNIRFAFDSTEWRRFGRAVTPYRCCVCHHGIAIGEKGLYCKALDRRMHEHCWDTYNHTRKDPTL